MTKQRKKTAGQRLDQAIGKTKEHAKRSTAYVKQHAGTAAKKMRAAYPAKRTRALLIAGAILLLAIAFWPRGGELATEEGAASIREMLAADGVPFRAVAAEGGEYVLYYDAESAVDRFDDALLHDWAMLYGTAAAHDCEEVSIVTSLAGEEVHKQTAPCEAVRALVRGLFTEEEFWLLVEHESLA